ncbi:MAG: WcaF family extracellular polysaccharide biosynthesis acetyltransferase [Cyanobacteria bacterium P01_F01_bin.33]
MELDPRGAEVEVENRAIHQKVDVASNRAARKWSGLQLLRRFVWESVRGPLFAMSPRPLWRWRQVLLRLFGARIGSHVHIFPSARIAIPWNLEIGNYASIGDGVILYNLGQISIGERATVSQYAHLCAGTHDYTDPTMPLLKKPIRIEADAWVCADAFVGPGVTIGRGAILGARAVAVSDVHQFEVAVGNPAMPKRHR